MPGAVLIIWVAVEDDRDGPWWAGDDARGDEDAAADRPDVPGVVPVDARVLVAKDGGGRVCQ